MTDWTGQALPDHLKSDLKVLFVGFNPSIRSGEVGHHFASPNNRFWKILYQAGLTPRCYRPTEDAELLQLGYGLTNLAARPTRAATDVSAKEYEEGRKILVHKIKVNMPGIVCYVGKGVYQIYARKKKADWGFQSSEAVPGVKDFVAPSSSGLVRMDMRQVTGIYRLLHQYLQDHS